MPRTNDEPNCYTGSCLCREVTFEIEGKLEHFYLCHCSRCRKDTGSAHGANLFSSKATLSLLSGQNNIQQYTLPQTLHTHTFCKTCGSPLPCQILEGKLLQVPAGSLDNNPPLKPTALISMASRASWVDIYRAADVIMIDDMP